MNAQQHDWDNLRLVLAIARGGGLSGAAKALGVHHATVLRRLESFERMIGVRLFERSNRGYVPTIDGEELATIAARLEEEILGVWRRVAGKDLRLSGTIRCATADYISRLVLPPVLARVRATYPDIALEVAISPQFASLSKRDADVALRPTNAPPETLVGRKVAEIGFGVFGARSYVETCGDGSPEWVAADESLSHLATAKWRQRYFPDARVTTRIDSLMAIHEAVRAGLGLAFLPVAAAQGDRSLVPYGQPIGGLTLDLWLLTHPDLRKTQRIRAFLQLAAQEIGAMSAWLRGSAGP